MVHVDIAVAKDQLVRIDEFLDEKVMLVGGLAVQQFHSPRKTCDIDLVCSYDTAQDIVNRLYPTEKWKIADVHGDELRPEIHIKSKIERTFPEIRFGPKILEREAYTVDWNDLKTDSIPFKYKSKELTNIHIPSVERLCLMKILSYAGRDRKHVDKIRQDLDDFLNLSNHHSFLIDRFYSVARQWGIEDELNRAFLDLSDDEKGIVERSNIASVASLLNLTSRIPGLCPPKLPPGQYEKSIEQASSSYFLLGFSAEEFQKNLSLREFLINRSKDGKPFHELRFLLLHPDSPHFTERLKEVNPHSDISALLSKKRNVIKGLQADLLSVPDGCYKSAEIRFYNEYPNWLLQLWDSEQCLKPPDRLAVMFHLVKKHAKKSPAYLFSDPTEEMFQSFLRYFHYLWEKGSPMSARGEFPPIDGKIDEKARKLVLFDFDGPIVDTNKLKKESLLEAFHDFKFEKLSIEEFYSERQGMTRESIIRDLFAILKGRIPTQEEIALITQAYANAYKDRTERISLTSGVKDILEKLVTEHTMIAIVSNAPRDEVVYLLEKFEIKDYFKAVYGSPENKIEAARRIIKELSTDPISTILIGDSDVDARVAKDVGCVFYALSSANDEVKKRADFVFDTYHILNEYMSSQDGTV